MHCTEAHTTNPAVWPVPYACAQLITPAVAAMDSCFVLIRTHQHGIASTVSLMIIDPPLRVQSTPLSASSTIHMW